MELAEKRRGVAPKRTMRLGGEKEANMACSIAMNVVRVGMHVVNALQKE